MGPIPPELLVPWIASNAFALALLGVAVQRPGVARWVFVVVFAAAALVNAVTVLRAPGTYVAGYAELAWPPYRAFIAGPFARVETPFVLTVAAGQLAVAVLLTRRPALARLGAIGAALFLLAITPLGLGSAFPAPLAMAAAAVAVAVRSASSARHDRGPVGP